jgi:hypothetical protein
MRMRSLPFFAAITAALAGCSGGNVTIGVESNDGGSRGASTDSGLHLGGSDANNYPDGIVTPQLEGGVHLDGSPPPPVPACPKTEPAAGSSCASVGEECEFGTSASTSCNVIVSCTSSGWAPVTPTTACAHGTCPAAYPSAMVGEACSPNGLDCGYEKGTCTCAPPSGPLMSDGGDSVRWQCFPKQTGCPSPRPTIGAPCTSSGVSCNYGVCAGGVELECKKGVWASVMVACPS